MFAKIIAYLLKKKFGMRRASDDCNDLIMAIGQLMNSESSEQIYLPDMELRSEMSHSRSDIDIYAR